MRPRERPDESEQQQARGAATRLRDTSDLLHARDRASAGSPASRPGGARGGRPTRNRTRGPTDPTGTSTGTALRGAVPVSAGTAHSTADVTRLRGGSPADRAPSASLPSRRRRHCLGGETSPHPRYRAARHTHLARGQGTFRLPRAGIRRRDPRCGTPGKPTRTQFHGSSSMYMQLFASQKVSETGHGFTC